MIRAVLLALGFILLASAGLAAALVVAGPTFAVVDVRQGGPGPDRILVPVPLLLARAALAVLPEQSLGRPDPELARLQPALGRLLAELRRSPDGELIRIEERGRTVTVRKIADELRVHVSGPGEVVRVVAPLKAAAAILRHSGEGRWGTHDLGAALGELPRGEVAYVRDRNQAVSVRIW